MAVEDAKKDVEIDDLRKQVEELKAKLADKAAPADDQHATAAAPAPSTLQPQPQSSEPAAPAASGDGKVVLADAPEGLTQTALQEDEGTATSRSASLAARAHQSTATFLARAEKYREAKRMQLLQQLGG